MNKRLMFVALLACMVSLAGCDRGVTVSQINIIPQPVFVVQKQPSFTLTKSTKICFENFGQNSPLAKTVLRTLRKMHIRPSVVGVPTHDCISFRINNVVNPELGNEGYLFEVNSDGIQISANSETGLFYGFSSFVQMLPDDVRDVTYNKITIPECTILDYPRYEWRGCMIDVSRHFFTVSEIKKVLMAMSAFKMNKLHLHLTDDHGWRVEIKSHPELCEVGAWRPDRSNLMWRDILPPQPGEQSSYGGFYSQDDIREIVRYANALCIDVIPEITLPSHCGALLASAPQLSCNGGDYHVQVGPCDTLRSELCVGSDSVLSYLYEVLDEIVDLFPGKYVHIGGYEVDGSHWMQCPKCVHRMNQEKLRNVQQLNDWFQAEIVAYLSAKNKISIGVSPNTLLSSDSSYVVMAHKSQADAMRMLRSDIPVVATSEEYCSFDCYQADSMYQPMAKPQMLPLAKVYEYEPFPVSVSDENCAMALGGQCNLWTEYISTNDQLEYMLFPRMCAFAEVLWSPKESRDWESFRSRVEVAKRYLIARGYKVCSGSFKPEVNVERAQTDANSRVVTIETETANTYVFYTLDGSTPTQSSHVYLAPFTVPKGTVLKTLSVYGGMERNRVYEYIIH